MRRNYNALTALLVAPALGLALGAAACAKPKPIETCNSPRAESDRTAGDSSATKDPSTWRLGRLIASAPGDPHNYISRRVGYRNPDVPSDTWHDGNPILERGNLNLLVKIGNGPVQFSVYDINRAGSPGCAVAPAAEFAPPAPITEIEDNTVNLIVPSWSK